MLNRNTEEVTKTITAPLGIRGIKALSDAPNHPPSAPITADNTAIVESLCVQNRAAAGGVIRKAMMRMSPTDCRPMTVTAVTRPSRRMSSHKVGQPSAAAKSSSKQSRVNSLHRMRVPIAAQSATLLMR